MKDFKVNPQIKAENLIASKGTGYPVNGKDYIRHVVQTLEGSGEYYLAKVYLTGGYSIQSKLDVVYSDEEDANKMKVAYNEMLGYSNIEAAQIIFVSMDASRASSILLT